MKNVGLWIDLQKAVVVSDTGRSFDIEFVTSDIGNYWWQYEVWSLPDLVRQRMSSDQFGRFYGRVSRFILDARSIHILGPCEAKTELAKRLQFDAFIGPISVESAGAMTNSEIVDRVLTRFADQADITSRIRSFVARRL